MNLRRVVAMTPAELATRSRQQALRLFERSGIGLRRGLRRQQGAPSGCFMSGAVCPGVSARTVAGRWPQASAAVTAAAQRAAVGRLDLLGYRDLSFGTPIDWSLDPVSGRRAPSLHWTRIDPLDATAVGDHKVIWELNRHQWLLLLAQAYHFLGEEAHAARAVAVVLEWLDMHPRGRGLPWASSLEASLRLIAWTWLLHLLRPSASLGVREAGRIVEAITEHAAHVERYLSTYFSPNTHLTGEALGLFYAGLMLPASGATRRWRTTGAKILNDQIGRQVLSDGVYAEQATCYLRYTLDIYLHYVVLARRNRVAVPEGVVERMQRLVDFLVAAQLPNGDLPAIGDADGGWLLPLVPRAAADVRATLSTAALVLRRPDAAWAAGELQPETVWMLGHEAVGAFRALGRRAPAAPPSRLFAEGGWVVMRSGWGRSAHHLLFDVGPLGCTASGGHGHADLLSLQVCAFGTPVIVDPGTYCYSADAAWRDAFRSSSFHSTVTVDGEPQAVPGGLFAWRERPRAWIERWAAGRRLEVAQARHDAYRRLRDPVVHRRCVLFVGRRFWVVIDDLEGVAEHRAAVRWQLAPVSARLETSGWARVLAGPGELLIGCLSRAPLEARLYAGSTAPRLGWVAPEYGQRLAAPQLVYTAATTLPVRVVTLLLPRRQRDAPPPAVTPVTDRRGEIVGLRLRGERTLRF